MSALRPSVLAEVPPGMQALRLAQAVVQPEFLAAVRVWGAVLLLARSLPALAAALRPPIPVQGPESAAEEPVRVWG